MSLFICTECYGVSYCVLATEPKPMTTPQFCGWGESLCPCKFREITKETGKALMLVLDK